MIIAYIQRISAVQNASYSLSHQSLEQACKAVQYFSCSDGGGVSLGAEGLNQSSPMNS